jgi:hypothetical protein
LQLVPHVFTSALDTHVLPSQLWNPLLQRIPQEPFVQRAMPFAGAGQGLHAPPHDSVDVSDLHALPGHSW